MKESISAVGNQIKNTSPALSVLGELKRLVLEGAVERRHQERRAGDDNTLSTDQVDVRAADPE